MALSLAVRPAAEAHIAEAYAWYLAESPKAALDFLASLDAAFADLSEFPLGYPVVHRDIRRVLAHRFPYAIYFLIADQHLFVLGVLHVRRHPRVSRALK